MSADHVVIAAGALTILGGFQREGHWPSHGTEAVIGTAGLAIVAAASENTPVAPLVNAFAWLFLLVAVFLVVPGLSQSFSKGKARHG